MSQILASPKRRLTLLLSGLLCVVLVGFVIKELVQRSEPAYGGKSVTTCIKDLSFGTGSLRMARVPPSGLGTKAPISFTTVSSYSAYRAAARRGSVTNSIIDYDASPAVEALKAIGAPAVPYLARALLQKDNRFRDYYRHHYPALAGLLGRWLPEPGLAASDMQWSALEGLGLMGDLALPAYPALLQAAAATNSRIAPGAIRILSELSQRHPVACVPLLIRALNNADPEIRRQAIQLLQDLGPRASVATPSLLVALKDINANNRARACQALVSIHSGYARVGPALVEALTDPERLVRDNAALALAEYGPEARGAIPSLQRSKDATNATERYCVRRALNQIDPEEAARADVE